MSKSKKKKPTHSNQSPHNSELIMDSSRTNVDLSNIDLNSFIEQNSANSMTHIKKMSIDFRNENQKKFWNLIENNDITICNGPAGTGKSYIQAAKALDLMRRFPLLYQKIIITVPAVQACGEELGYIKGSVEEKLSGHTFPTFYLLEKLLSKVKVDRMVEQGKISVVPLAFLRGRTFESCIVLCEESQNLTPISLKTLLTRIGENSKMIISGDLEQNDRDTKKNSANGLEIAMNKLDNIPGIGMMTFDMCDVVRHKLIGTILNRLNN